MTVVPFAQRGTLVKVIAAQIAGLLMVGNAGELATDRDAWDSRIVSAGGMLRDWLGLAVGSSGPHSQPGDIKAAPTM